MACFKKFEFLERDLPGTVPSGSPRGSRSTALRDAQRAQVLMFKTDASGECSAESDGRRVEGEDVAGEEVGKAAQNTGRAAVGSGGEPSRPIEGGKAVQPGGRHGLVTPVPGLRKVARALAAVGSEEPEVVGDFVEQSEELGTGTAALPILRFQAGQEIRPIEKEIDIGPPMVAGPSRGGTVAQDIVHRVILRESAGPRALEFAVPDFNLPSEGPMSRDGGEGKALCKGGFTKSFQRLRDRLVKTGRMIAHRGDLDEVTIRAGEKVLDVVGQSPPPLREGDSAPFFSSAFFFASRFAFIAPKSFAAGW